MPPLRKCNHCGLEAIELSDLKQFQTNIEGKHGHNNCCWVCASLWNKYSIHRPEYDSLVLQQDNRCAICGKKQTGRRLDVDHDHVTGRIRGLLCWLCNRGLGQFLDDPDLLQKAVGYLTK